MIDHCAFGAMTIKGRRYTSDLLVFPGGRVADHWRRDSSHRLTMKDIQELLAAGPEIIIAGTGIFGRMKAEAGLEAALSDMGIEWIAVRTKAAVERFNTEFQRQRKVGGCFHLTC